MFTKNAKCLFDFLMGFGNSYSEHKPISCYDKKAFITYTKSNIKAIDVLMKTFPTKAIDTTETVYGDRRIGVVFGTGTGTPSVDDVYLFGTHLIDINSNNVTYVTSYSNDESGKRCVTTVYTITNTTSNDMTIGEIGLTYEITGKHGTSTSSSTQNVTAVLCEHTVLDTPITIPAGGIGQITYTICMEYPTFE